MTPLHLAILCHRLTPHDHAARQAALLADALAELGHRVTLLCAGATPMDLARGVKLVCHQGKLSRFAPGLVMYRRWLRAQLASLAPDHSISVTTLAPAEIVIPCDGTAASRSHAIRSMRAPLPAKTRAALATVMPKSILHRMLEQRTLADPMVRAIFADNAVIQSQLVHQHRIDTRLASISPAVSDVALIAEQSASLRERLARGLGLSEQSQWIVFPFGAAWLGGLEPVVLAFKALVDGGADVTLLLAGRWRYTHLAWVAHLGLRDRVRFLGLPDEPARLIAASDLLVQPTQYDPGGGWALTALSLGRPVVISDACGAAEWVGEGRGAVLPDPVSPAALLKAIRAALETSRFETQLQLPPRDRAEALLALLLGDPQA